MTTRIGFIIYWLLLAVILLVIIPVGTFVVPTMAPGWKAQGLTQVPLFWQILVDLSDFLLHRWFIWMPLYMAVGIALKAMSKPPER